MSSVDGRNARRLFKLPLFTMELSIQEGDRYVVVVAEGMENKKIGEEEIEVDAYLLDIQSPRAGRKDLTLGRFSEISDAAISRNGDVVFSNIINQAHPDGIYLISSQEVHAPIPKVEKLFDGPAGYVDWSPNGEDIVFSNLDGIFLLNIFTRQTSLIVREDGFRPVFSPDGKHLAFFTRTFSRNQLKRTYGIGIVALDAPADVKQLKIEKGSFPQYITWSADGRYIAYVSYTKLDVQNIEQFQAIGNFVIPATGGEPEPILLGSKWTEWVFEWVDEAYPVEPNASLVTTWGELKTQ